ncbi:ABC transporter permease subunit [bacterium]|nr:ABC transporter permease subunit [bacterium]
MNSGFMKIVFSVLILCALLLAWQFAVRYNEIPIYLIPAPSDVIMALVRGFQTGIYTKHIIATLTEVFAGFSIGLAMALVLGLLIALNRTVETYVYPYIIMFQSMPKVALAPVLVIWFGLGMTSKIVTVALITFFPILVNTIVGLRSADFDRINLMRSLGASRWQVFRMLQLPGALPFIVAGIEVGIIMSLLGAIVAEFVGAEAGLGMLIQSMNTTLDVAGQFSILIILSVIGLSMNKTVGFIGDRLLFWDSSRKAKAAMGRR